MRYKHDCDKCEFQGKHGPRTAKPKGIEYTDNYYPFPEPWEEFDIYFCRQHGIPTIVARYDDKGSCYFSGEPHILEKAGLVLASKFWDKFDDFCETLQGPSTPL